MNETVSPTSREPIRTNIFGNAFSRIQAVLTTNMLVTTSPDFRILGLRTRHLRHDTTFATFATLYLRLWVFLGLLGFDSNFNDAPHSLRWSHAGACSLCRVTCGRDVGYLGVHPSSPAAVTGGGILCLNLSSHPPWLWSGLTRMDTQRRKKT